MPERAATHANYLSATLAGVFGLLSVNEWAAVIGALAAAITAIANIWFRHQHLKLARTTVRLQLKSDDE